MHWNDKKIMLKETILGGCASRRVEYKFGMLLTRGEVVCSSFDGSSYGELLEGIISGGCAS